MVLGLVVAVAGLGGALVVSPAAGANHRDAEVRVDGGRVTSRTEISVSVNGGVASASASGGSGNTVVTNGSVSVSRGNGGTIRRDASGGTITSGDIVSGGNTGTVITIRDTRGR